MTKQNKFLRAAGYAVAIFLILAALSALLGMVKTDNCNHALQSMETLNNNFKLDRMDYNTYNSSFDVHNDYYNKTCN